MFQRILVPTDLTDESRQSLNLALALASPTGARVILLHVIERIPNLDDQELRTFYDQLVRTAEDSNCDLIILQALDDRHAGAREHQLQGQRPRALFRAVAEIVRSGRGVFPIRASFAHPSESGSRICLQHSSAASPVPRDSKRGPMKMSKRT